MHIRLYPAHGQNMPKPSARCLDFPSLQTEKTQLSGLCLRQGATDRLSVSQSNLWGLSWHWRHAFADADAVTNAADDAEEGDKDEIRMRAMVAVLAVAWHQTRWKKTKQDAAAGPEHDCHADDGVLAILHKRSPLRVLWSFQTPFCPKYEYNLPRCLFEFSEAARAISADASSGTTGAAILLLRSCFFACLVLGRPIETDAGI